MNLSFKSHFPWPGPDGKPELTYFEGRILAALAGTTTASPSHTKRHTIRRAAPDGTCRYREGMPLHMVTGPRFKPERFAIATCTGVQPIKMELLGMKEPNDGFFMLAYTNTGRLMENRELHIAQLAANDGLTRHQFTKWFMLDIIQHGPFIGHIIHWTDLRY